MGEVPVPPLALPPGGRAVLAALATVVAWLGALALSVGTAGNVDPAAGAALAAFLLVLALIGPVGAARDLPLAARIAVAAPLLACALQLVPLPEPLRALLAPGPTSARSDLHRLGLQGAWAPITVDVGGTITELVLWGGAAALLALCARPGGPPMGTRLAFGVLVVLHGLAWIDWIAGTRVLPLTHIEDPWGVGQSTLRRSDFVTGWLVNRNHWAALGLLLWPLALAWGAKGSRIRWGLGGLAAAATVASIVSTKSRAGLGLVALQALGIGAVALARLPRRVRFAFLAAVVVGLLLARGPLFAYLDRIPASDVAGRADLYAATARLALESPLLGWGMGTFQGTFPSVQPDGALYTYSHAHSDPLEWIAGAGAFGVLLVGALLAVLWRGARDRTCPWLARTLWVVAAAGCALAACVEFPLEVPAVRFVWLGVLFAGPAPWANRGPSDLPSAARPGPVPTLAGHDPAPREP